MKLTVTVDQKAYEVEIENLDRRPIIATVDGTKFEIWPEEAQTSIKEASFEPAQPTPASSRPQPAAGYVPSGASLNIKSIRAPIPGVIVEILTKAGDEVDYGDILFVIEAMKMRNAIRASRPGTVKEISVALGQTVNHNDILLEFVE